MVDFNNATFSELVHHSNFEQRIALQFGIACLLLNQFVDAESLIQIFVATNSMIHKISNFETSFMFSLLLPDCALVIFECHLFVYIEGLFFFLALFVEFK